MAGSLGERWTREPSNAQRGEAERDRMTYPKQDAQGRVA